MRDLMVTGMPGAAACAALAEARSVFETFNIDLMYGLPGQTLATARADIEEGARSGVPHLSAYQLTIEPNTVFFSRPIAATSW